MYIFFFLLSSYQPSFPDVNAIKFCVFPKKNYYIPNNISIYLTSNSKNCIIYAFTFCSFSLSFPLPPALPLLPPSLGLPPPRPSFSSLLILVILLFLLVCQLFLAHTRISHSFYIPLTQPRRPGSYGHCLPF